MSLGTAVIVGVGPGLGLALARTFAAADHPVALLARDATRLDCYLVELNRAERPARAYTADAAHPAQLRSALEAAIDDLGAPDVLIYNAAVLRPDTPTDGDDDGWVNALTVDVLGAKVAAETIHPALRDGRGSLLFTGGGLALQPSAQFASCRSARPHSAPTCRPSTPISRAPASTPPASPSPATSAAARSASTRPSSPRPTCTSTTSPKTHGGTSCSATDRKPTMDNQNTTVSTFAERARAGQPVGVGIVGLGASPDSWAETAHLPALRAVPATRSAE
jgi:NAD(P)-dependent dehydrogenase (short-subunit alcohol dehydrogenase family)